jgi:hypothetical protein
MALEKGEIEELVYLGALSGVLLKDGLNKFGHLRGEAAHVREAAAADLN